MQTSAQKMHETLRKELNAYIMSQYFGKNLLLQRAIEPHLDEEGRLYREPYIESTPAYHSTPNGIQTLNTEPWLKDFFGRLSRDGLGVYASPFEHQLHALQGALDGQDMLVSTGTGSGKTECFMWPMIAKLCTEAKTQPGNWQIRGVRTIVMYPMNALVADQLSRLRRLIGDPEGKFVRAFRDTAGISSRRPQFGMYTGRTAYPGKEPNSSEDRRLAASLSSMICPSDDENVELYTELLRDGKIPAKRDLTQFVAHLKNNKHITDPEDAELITRFEMQKTCPDILITNYSMLEYMLLRPQEAEIWEQTKEWLNLSKQNKLLFVIDEAHMYRGSSGGEVALLLRRLFHKLGIGRDKVQFILTTASIPYSTDQERAAVHRFTNALTSLPETGTQFEVVTGITEKLDGGAAIHIPSARFMSYAQVEDDQDNLDALNRFWVGLDGMNAPFKSLAEAQSWMYDHIVQYDQFHELLDACRGSATSICDLASQIFPDLSSKDAEYAAYRLIDIASLARDDKGNLLFPVRLHLLFRGLQGVYACLNPKCKHAQSHEGVTLGSIFLSGGVTTCPHCGGAVYELINDRRCGALFIRGFVSKMADNEYLWRAPGLVIDNKMQEMHLYIVPQGDYGVGAKASGSRICYIDPSSGFLKLKGDPRPEQGFVQLYHHTHEDKGRPDIRTFTKCPHCLHQLGRSQLTSFTTRGNQSFYNLVKAQFNEQPPVPALSHDPNRFPNEGRKVLLFSDSRQRAARLARDMSEASDDQALMQLFVLAMKAMPQNQGLSLNDLYWYIVQVAATRRVPLFHQDEREKFLNQCTNILKQLRRAEHRGDTPIPDLGFDNAPLSMHKHLIRLFCGGYNTLYDTALGFLMPSKQTMNNALDELEDYGIESTYEEFIEVFSAWLLDILPSHAALGQNIDRELKRDVLQAYATTGLNRDWNFNSTMMTVMGWEEDAATAKAWKNALGVFLDEKNGEFSIDMKRVIPVYAMDHNWMRCRQCSELTPYPLREHCPTCGSGHIEPVTTQEYAAMAFWRNPAMDAQQGAAIRIIDTQEHTAQLSYKDERDDMWSLTEQYEMRFRDLIKEGETSVDVLSSTTTMEVGIDIGSLVAVGLRNMPPMRENYQQRAGRAGRRGAALSTIITFCEDSPHDALYFNNPAPMFRGKPRDPWIDVTSRRLLSRHICMVAIQTYLSTKGQSLDAIDTIAFFQDLWESFDTYIDHFSLENGTVLLDHCTDEFVQSVRALLQKGMLDLQFKCAEHPELYENTFSKSNKSLLDSLYEEGIIPTYSFPKDVVSTFISDGEGKLRYRPDRGLDMAISEYAPGRSIVVDKRTFQIGGLYYYGSERRPGKTFTPAQSFIDDSNYNKPIFACACGWFGLEEDKAQGGCPYCGNQKITQERSMIRPWGFAPVNGREASSSQISETYSYADKPLCSTLPDMSDMQPVDGYRRMRMFVRPNQRIILLNQGPSGKGFMICPYCGAAVAGDDKAALRDVSRPYLSKFAGKKCYHEGAQNYSLGYDFRTDMLVIEIAIDPARVNTSDLTNPWIRRAALSLSEALRLQTSAYLDVEFTEINAGYRIRENGNGTFVDLYMYDNLSSGAGYSTSISDHIGEILDNVHDLLDGCKCENACHECLKHYRNRNDHAGLDRKAAIQLLDWAQYERLASMPSPSEARAFMAPLEGVLARYDIGLAMEGTDIVARRGLLQKKMRVYPYMMPKPKHDGNTIMVSDYHARLARPYAVEMIQLSL